MSDSMRIEFLRRVRLSGTDTRAFLQSQLTRDMDIVDDRQWRLAAWCDPAGRVVCTMMLRGDEDHVDLVLPAVDLETIITKLRMYTIGRSVEFAPAEPVGGGRGSPPDGAAPLEPDPTRWLARTTVGREGDASDWLAADIRAGIPWLAPPVRGRFLPQFLGLERHGALSHDKGCYPGQEVIARLHHRGTVKHTLSGFRIDGEDLPEPGDRLRDADDRPAGEVVNAVATDAGTIGLAVVRVDLPADAAVNIGNRSVRLTPPDGLC